MDDGSGDGGDGFKVKYVSDAAEVMDGHEAGARGVGDMAGEREVRIKSNTKITNRGIRCESSGRRVI